MRMRTEKITRLYTLSRVIDNSREQMAFVDKTQDERYEAFESPTSIWSTMTVRDPYAAGSVDRRRTIFAALVAAQDDGFAVDLSRTNVAIRYAVTVEDVQAIEKEGIKLKWPPL